VIVTIDRARDSSHIT